MKGQKTIQGAEWVQRWAGSYTFISCAYWASQYFDSLNRILGKGFESTIFIHKKGTVSFFVKKSELDKLGIHLALKVKEDKKETIALLDALKKNADLIMEIMDRLEGKIMSKKEYDAFMEVFERHLAYHVFMKKTVDYLPKDLLDAMIDRFKDARIYSEPVYSRTEQFFRSMAKAISKKEGVHHELLTCLLKEEIEDYIIEKRLPSESLLKKRFEYSVLYYDKRKLTVFTGDEARGIDKQMSEEEIPKDFVKGSSVVGGVVRGRCRIITDPHAQVDFLQGDILVSGMTRPEFVRFYNKAAAIVTDVGGRLCHAALVAREMNTPCVVGTKNATKVFKDGDYLEVNATEGIVKKVKEKK